MNSYSEHIHKIDEENNISIVKLEQRTDEWKDLRKRFITASDAVELIISFIKEESFFGRPKIDFFRYKLGHKEKEFDSFQKSLMNRGKLNEPIAISKLDSVIEDTLNKNDSNRVFRHMDEAVFVKDGWALASTDSMIVDDENNLVAPVEIKYTESQKTFDKYSDINHYNYYQLAFQMYVTNTDKGLMMALLNGETSNVCIRYIDRESSYFKEIEESIDRLKEYHHIACVKREIPHEIQDSYDRLHACVDCFIEDRNRSKDEKKFDENELGKYIESLIADTGLRSVVSEKHQATLYISSVRKDKDSHSLRVVKKRKRNTET